MMGLEDSAPKSQIVAVAEALDLAEGSIWMTAMRGRQEPPESLARGTLSQGFVQELGRPPSLLLQTRVWAT